MTQFREVFGHKIHQLKIETVLLVVIMKIPMYVPNKHSWGDSSLSPQTMEQHKEIYEA